ncbi:hypothetical protein LEP1GSC101_0176 [Leptospira borgpetersenii str. UI 09149]|nr:hypothetical protein LEP1GSC101_0176 [Leptospira borgpetersenii str. UI 09149]
MRQHNSPKKQTVLNLQEPHFCDLETNKSNSEYLEPAIRGLRTEDRGQKETEELLHHEFRMQLAETEKKTALEKQNIPYFRNRFSFKTKIVSFFTILSFNISFVIPLTVFSFLSSSFSPLDAQSVPTLGSTKQFANDELKPYVDAAKAGATDSGNVF